tara:strand:+ start:242 stop:388 length:147 start_codon:yes stop_codon:yes gene_type:complete
MDYVKYVTVKIEYESEEVWDKSLEDIQELIKMMNNISRRATIIEVAEE